MSLRQRFRQPEIMDQPDLDVPTHLEALRGLETINRISRSARTAWKPIERLVRASRIQGPLKILDVACGGGDVAIGLARCARSCGIEVFIDGCDISQVAVAHAAESARRQQFENVAFFQRDVIEQDLPGEFHVTTCSLFLHHLEDHQAVVLLRRMAAAARMMVVVSDLRRTPLGYAMAWLGVRLLSRSPVVHADGPMSVAAAFAEQEVRDLAQRAGLPSISIERRWPQRFLLVARHSSAG